MNPSHAFRHLACTASAILLALPSLADSPLVFNEIMYHPATNETSLEWVELQNQHGVDLDVSGWRLDGGIAFTFPAGTVVPAGLYVVVASAPAALSVHTGLTNVAGPFLDRLANGGETLRLRNNNGRVLDEVVYGVEGDWPVAPDGAGPSLARRRPNTATHDSRNWQASAEPGGTPGRENFPVLPPTVLTNTVLAINGTWRFNDSGVDPGLAWREPAYDDSSWPQGASAFYQTDAVLPAPRSTPLAPGRVAAYFRTAFTVTGNPDRTELQLQALIDDGAVGYLNGTEVFRRNMPAGPINHSTLALGSVGDATFGDPIVIPPGAVRPGNNVLAVEVHQAPRFANYPQVILDASPLGYWRLGETAGAALDFSIVSGAQPGAYSGLAPANLGQAGPRPADSVNGQFIAGFEAGNSTPRFSGNADGGNDVVTIADPGVFNFAATRQFTLELWVNGPPAQEEGGAVIAKGTGGGGEQFAVDIVGGSYRFFAWDGGTPNTPFVCQANVGPNNTWQHLVAVLDQPAGRMKLYVNGVERGSATPRATLINTPHEVSIGARKNSGSAGYDLNFDGRIDEVAIYNRALDPSEIVAHLNAALIANNAAGPDTNDMVFGLAIAGAETQPPSIPARVLFNELASSTNADFWLELINPGPAPASLDGCFIARLGGLTNRAYTLPAQTLAPGELRTVTKAELGFGVDSGDRLILHAPDRSAVLDAVVAKKEPRGRAPDGQGDWWFPTGPTPGASNAFVFRDELVINEIMYHPRELAAVPATYSPTNTLVHLTNTWRYQGAGADLGIDWRAPGFPDTDWSSGPALFYAPVSTVTLPVPRMTFLPITNSAGIRVVTFYFRTRFIFSGDTNALQVGLRSVIDDGAVFYLNGTEVLRVNMPETNITSRTLATVNVGIPTFTGPLLIPASALVPGVNTLAVEIHQVATNSSDVNFAAELSTWKELSPALPFRDSPESWIELFNRSSNAINLAGWRLDEGIDYRFATNDVIASGGYLVVARDLPHFRSLHPAVPVAGPFTNRLSRGGDLVVLKDPANNPADQVRYFDGGRWPAAADGGGSSLELRDPRADRNAGEAWAASDESGGASWRTYTWRGLAQAGQATEPTLWREFALGLLDGAGEVLIDDVSIVETPAATPKQLLANRGFDDGSAAHWRFLGNHRLSRIVPEPGNPANHVLHLFATGPCEYQGNQIESTLTNNTPIVDGREYEVSFRARWLSGHRKLNARLYFNRLARTFDLSVPDHSGTPGAPNSRRVDNLGPTFDALSHQPTVPDPGQPVQVRVRAADPDRVAALTLRYSIAGGPWLSANMAPDPEHSTPAASAYVGSIPGQPAATIVQFHVEAVDGEGATALFPAAGTNSRALYVVQDGQAARGRRHFRLILTAADASFLHTPTNTLSNELLRGTVIGDELEVYYDVGARLKGSFVGRNVARVGFHVAFDPVQPFRGVHPVVSVDRAMHTAIGSVGEILVKHIAGHAGGIPNVYDDIALFIAPLPAYTTTAGLRLSAFDNDWLDAQFEDGADGSLFEVEVLRWNVATVNGNPEAPKAVGNESGGTGYANLEVQDYGSNPESYRWFFLPVNNRTADDFSVVTNFARTFSLTGTNLEASARRWLDVDEWLRTMAYQQLVGTADAWFTGANIHNFRVYARPEDRRMLYLPWDWDSSFLASPTASINGNGNLAKLLALPPFRRAYLNHLYDLIDSTFNPGYMARWTAHYGAVGRQDFSSTLTYIQQRAASVSSQLPNATFAITNQNGNSFTVSNQTVVLGGTAPVAVRTIEINGVPYPVTWLNDTTWRLVLPLAAGSNPLLVQGVEASGLRRTNLADSITITNVGPAALRPLVINEWMADNSAPGGWPDPADGLFQDWIELFNPNPVAVNLGGWSLTDNPGTPDKWVFPTNTLIGSQDFLLVWADEDGGQNGPDSGLHASFRLSSGGEFLALFSAAGVQQHAVSFGPQITGVSQGLFPDGDTNTAWSMPHWTPAAPNRIGALAAPALSVSAQNPDGSFQIDHPSIPGRVYELQLSPTLTPPNWTALQATRATTASVRFIVAASAEPQRYYRILLLP